MLDHFLVYEYFYFVACINLVVNIEQHSLRQTNHIFKGKDDDNGNGKSILRCRLRDAVFISGAGSEMLLLSPTANTEYCSSSRFSGEQSKGAVLVPIFFPLVIRLMGEMCTPYNSIGYRSLGCFLALSCSNPPPSFSETILLFFYDGYGCI